MAPRFVHVNVVWLKIIRESCVVGSCGHIGLVSLVSCLPETDRRRAFATRLCQRSSTVYALPAE